MDKFGDVKHIFPPAKANQPLDFGLADESKGECFELDPVK